MRKIFILFWCLVPLSVAAYHYGPGQKQLTVDGAGVVLTTAADHVAKAQNLLAAGEQKAANAEFAEAIGLFDVAIQTLPADRKRDIQRIRLAKAKALFSSQKNPTARTELEALMEDLNGEDESERDEILVADTRDALAASQYYMAWLMRIEGLPREVWEPETDRSRQNYRLLAEQAEEDATPDRAAKAKENLESAIRLALVDLDELKGLPLPSQ